MDNISIDRLVLEIPGLTPEQAGDVARRVGAGLAESTIQGKAGGGPQSKAGEGKFGRISVTLDSNLAGASDTPRLANLIVAALLRQIG